MTGGAFSESASSFINTVANKTIAKPFDIGALRATVLEVCAQEGTFKEDPTT